LDKFCEDEEAKKVREDEAGKPSLSENYMAGVILYDLVQSGWPGL